MAFCSSCGAQMDDGVKFCPKCGSAATGEQPAGAAPAAGGGSGVSGAAEAPAGGAADPANDNLMGAASYLLIPAVIFLLVEPYNRNRFIRFHSFQALAYAVAAFAINIALNILSVILSFVGIGLILLPVSMLFSLATFVLWIVLVIKAFQGQTFKLPMIGDWADKQA